MSTLPAPYDRQATFTNFSTEPDPTVGQDLEAEFNAIKQSQDATQKRLSEIQRDDGLLANMSVHPDALSAAVRNLLTISGDIRGLWVGLQVYGVGDCVEAPDGITYLATVEHVANASFTVDANAGRWIAIDSSAALSTILRADLSSNALGKGSDMIDFSGIRVRQGFWADQVGGARINRFRDRVFFGDGVIHTGNLSAPYGNTWMATLLATWPEKNSQVTSLSSEGRIALLGASHKPSGSVGSTSTTGVAGFTYNEGTGTTARAGYFDATAVGGAQGATYGIEIAVSNRGTNAQANSYFADATAVFGQHITVEGGTGYTIGDSNTLAPEGTQPGTAAINIGGGSVVSAAKKWNLGIRFSAGSLTGSDGFTGNAIAIDMAKGHTLRWMSSSSILGATLRSDVTAASGQDVGLLFKNNEVQFTGTSEIAMVRFQRDTVGTPVNTLIIKNARTNVNATIQASGTDTNTGVTVQTQGSGIVQFKGQGGSAESLRLQFNANYVNFVTVTGALTGSGATVAAAGADADVDLILGAKGANGRLRSNYASVAATTPSSFSAARRLEFKDSTGTVYYIPLATATW